jgi:hypothetical protein
MGVVLIRIGERLAGPESPSTALGHGLVPMRYSSSKAD